MTKRISGISASALAWAKANEQRAMQALAGILDRGIPTTAKLSSGVVGIVLPSAVGEQQPAGEQLDPARVQRVADLAERLRRARQEGQA